MRSDAISHQLAGEYFSPRIVVKLHGNHDLVYYSIKEARGLFSNNTILPWEDLVKQFPGISINRLFSSVSTSQVFQLVSRAKESDPDYQPVDFLSYYSISCPVEINTNALLQLLLQNKNVESAYIETGPVAPPSVNAEENPLSRYQGYLNAAPVGIDARYAWRFKGCDGKGKLKFIDIEQGWILNHEDISVRTLPLTGINHHAFQDHGAAVLGIIAMQDNAKGGVGITPKAKGYVISQWRPDGSFNTADAVMTAIANLDFGDILLLESQCFDSVGSGGVWPVEIQEAIFQAIRLATALGIIVIEPAGNGNLNLMSGNDLDYFASNGKKTLNRNSPDFRDSGAIIVGASTASVPHKRIHYSNYGTRVDCYAWGEGILTAGRCPQSSGFAINTYTGRFGGTSGAAAIIAGAAIAVQSMTEANDGFRFSPKEIRSIFSSGSYGTASANGMIQDKIGVMPDLKKIIDHILTITGRKNKIRTFDNDTRIENLQSQY